MFVLDWITGRKGVHTNGWNLYTALEICPLQGTCQDLNLVFEIAAAYKTFSWQSHFFGLKLCISKSVLYNKTKDYIYFSNTTVERLPLDRHYILSYLISTTLWDKCHCSHVKNGETEDQWGKETFRVIQLFMNGIGIQTQGCLTPSDGFSHHTILPFCISQSSDRRQTAYSRR